MPRISAAALSVVAPEIQATRPRLSPPVDLPSSALAVWHATIAALPASWFAPEQAPIIERYCRHIARAREIEALIADTDPLTSAYARLVTLAGAETARILALARAMRLTNQSRLKAETAASAAAKYRPIDDTQ